MIELTYLAAAAEAAEHAAAEHETFLGLGAEAWVALSLFLLLGLFAYLGVHRIIARALDTRSDRIRAELEEARNLKQEAQTELAELQRRRREADAEAEAIIAQAEEDARLLLHEAEQQAEDIGRRRRRAAEQKIAQAEQDAVRAVRAEAAHIAVAAARRVIADELAGKRGDEVIAEVIERIDTKPN